jgi:VWFA-related protein
MRPSLAFRASLVGCIPVAAFLAPGAGVRAAPQGAPQSQQQQQPTFRGGVTAVPIDVRVVDRAGRPVTDLKQQDFTVFEDDVWQPIVHFSRQVLEPQTPGPGLRARLDVPVFDDNASPQNHRVFLIVLGAGSLGNQPLINRSETGAVHGPPTMFPYATKVIDGLVHFVRERLLPQDQVALLAYNRATDFTADHETVAKLLEAFKQSEAAGAAAMRRQMLAAPIRTPPDSVAAMPPVGADSASAPELGLAEYVQARSGGASDVANLRYGLNYLRYMEGEKHLIWVTPNGVVPFTPGSLGAAKSAGTIEGPKELAAAASDARVAVHPIQSGGLSEAPGSFVSPLPIMMPRILAPSASYFGSGSSGASSGVVPERSAAAGEPHSSLAQPGWDRPAPAPPVPIPGLNGATMQALSDLRTLASLTGGMASAMTLAADAVDRIDAQTRASYLLVYYPSNTTFDGRYRQVRVEVNRPDVTVLFRHGYYARQQVESLSRRDAVTEGRFSAAAVSARDIRDIRLSVTPSFTRDKSGKRGDVLVRVVIDGAALAWTTDDLSRHVAHLDVGVFCGDAKENVVGQAMRTLDITLTEQRFARLAAEGVPYSVWIPVEALARYVKVIVYNYEADLVGSTTVRMK